MNKDMILGIGRHVLTFGGGFLVAKGWLSADELSQGVELILGTAGGSLGLVGLVLSILAKRRAPQP